VELCQLNWLGGGDVCRVSRDLRGVQERVATPRTDVPQHWGVALADPQRTARFSMAAAEAKAAKAVKAKAVNCILKVLVGRMVECCWWID